MNAVNPVNPSDETRPSVKDRIYEKWDFLCSCSSIFGLTRFHYQTNPFMMFVWLVSHMGFIAVGFYMVGSACADFVTYPVVTNVDTLLKTPVTFPAVTLCAPGLNDTLIDKSSYYFGKYTDTFETLKVELETFKYLDTFSDEQINCLRFNGLGTGDSSSLRNVTGPVVKKNTFYMYLDFGDIISGVVYIAHNSLNTFGNDTPRYVYANHSYNFFLNRRLLEEKLPPPYNTCLNTSYDYHVENCLEECINIQVANKYSCSLTGYYTNNSLTNCLKKDETSNMYEDGEDGFRNEFEPYCQTQCVEECFSSSYPYNVVEDALREDDGLQLCIMFQDLRYTYVTQIPKSSGFDLFGFIGGTLGMVCGFQLATFVEFLDFLFEVVSVVLDERKKRKLEKTQVHVAIS